MQRAAVFVHPSPWETFGVVAAEALAAGLPVAAVPSGGVEEVVGRDGRFGEIAADTGPEALAAAIGRVLDDPGRFNSGTMRDHVVRNYAPEVVASQLVALYSERLAGDGRAIQRTAVDGGAGAEPGAANRGAGRPARPPRPTPVRERSSSD